MSDALADLSLESVIMRHFALQSTI